MVGTTLESISCTMRSLVIAGIGAISVLPIVAKGQSFEELKSSSFPDRAIIKESVARIKIRDEEYRYITFIELDREEAYRSVMDCKDWRTRRFSVNRPRPYNQPSAFYENSATLNHIQIQAIYCPQMNQLPLSSIDYDKGMRSQVWKDRSLLPAEYFLKCPQKDAEVWACIDFRDEWKEQRWDPKQ